MLWSSILNWDNFGLKALIAVWLTKFGKRSRKVGVSWINQMPRPQLLPKLFNVHPFFEKQFTRAILFGKGSIFWKKFRNPKIAIEVGLESMFYIVLLGNVKRSDCLIICCYCIEGKGSHDVFSLFTPPWPWSAESSISLTRGHNSALFTYISTTRSASNVQVTFIWRITFLTYHNSALFAYISNLLLFEV